jgi:glycosyltransferase involved in cell wall biosynthesis
MKVLLLSSQISRNAGGLYTVIINLGKSLLKIKNVHPVALGFTDEYAHLDLPEYGPIEAHQYKIIGPPGVGFSLGLSKKIKKINPDLIHAFGIWHYFSHINRRYASRENIPYIISVSGMLDPWILNARPWKKKLGLKLYVHKFLANASCLHALAISEYNSIRKMGYKNPVAIIPNGVNPPDLNIKKDNSLEPEWKRADNRKVMLFLSRLHAKKGLENLINAWAEITPYHSKWKLIIAGETKDKSYIDKLLNLQKSLKLENDVFFIGNQANEAKDMCFRSSSAFILPSFSEGMPMAVLEAWAYKLPSLITEDCNLPEGFENNAAVKINADKDDIVKRLSSFFEMPDESREEIANNARALVEKKFSWDTVAQQTKDVYDWSLNGGDAPVTVRFD